jgi:hypothetical protein
VEVTPTGKKNYYKGAESILEYYSLQNSNFNPPSYRVATSTHNQTEQHYPKWDKSLDDGRRIHSWSFDPAITLGHDPAGHLDPACVTQLPSPASSGRQCTAHKAPPPSTAIDCLN